MTDDMQNLKALAVMTGINKMLRDSHFSICSLDSAIAALQVVPDGDAYAVLRQLHCVHYVDMPAEIRRRLPDLIARCTFLGELKPQFGLPRDLQARLESQGAQLCLVRMP